MGDKIIIRKKWLIDPSTKPHDVAKDKDKFTKRPKNFVNFLGDDDDEGDDYHGVNGDDIKDELTPTEQEKIEDEKDWQRTMDAFRLKQERLIDYDDDGE